jgi:hypothetical protein
MFLRSLFPMLISVSSLLSASASMGAVDIVFSAPGAAAGILLNMGLEGYADFNQATQDAKVKNDDYFLKGVDINNSTACGGACQAAVSEYKSKMPGIQRKALTALIFNNLGNVASLAMLASVIAKHSDGKAIAQIYFVGGIPKFAFYLLGEMTPNLLLQTAYDKLKKSNPDLPTSVNNAWTVVDTKNDHAMFSSAPAGAISLAMIIVGAYKLFATRPAT